MYKEFLEWADEDTLAEWVDGEVEMRSPASRRHQALVGFLSGVMGILGPGAMVGSPEHTGIDRSLSMIGAVWRRFPRTRGDRPFAEYDRSGVKEYWLIDYAGRWAGFHVLGDDGRYHSTGPGPSGTWTEGVYTSTAIEGFWIDVGRLWQEPLPQVLAVLRKLALV
jgi:hypothetical protein